jgi:alpha-tubulin suppressor-like RCC1 family protein
MKILHFVLAALTTLSLSANVITPSVAAPTQPTTQFTTAITSGAKQIAVGANHACAITQSDTVKCWGRNDLGQLGDGTTIDRSVPVDAKVVTKPVKQIVAREQATCALYTDGGVVCWGAYTEVAGSVNGSMQPPNISKALKKIGIRNASAICGIDLSDRLGCWSFAPEYIDNANFTWERTDIADFYASEDNRACIINKSGAIECAYLSYLDDSPPVFYKIDYQATKYVSVRISSYAGCGLTDSGLLRCGWFYFSDSPYPTPVEDTQIGGSSSLIETSASVSQQSHLVPPDFCFVIKTKLLCRSVSIGSPVFDTFVDVTFDKAILNVSYIFYRDYAANTYWFACVLLEGGEVKCWGNNDYGQVGDGSAGVQSHTAVKPANVTQPIKSVNTGWDHTCVTATAGNAQCFGAAMLGQIGNGTHGACCGIDNSQDTNIPQTVISNTAVTQLALGGNHSCAIQNGGAWCWGDNHNGQVGNGNTTDADTPVQVTGLISGVTKLAAGSHNTCAIQNSALKCWGWNDRGQVGDGSTADWWLPTPVISLTQPVSDVAIGGAHACAVLANGALNCWGRNDYGQLGDGTSGNNRLALVAVKGISNVVEVAPADTHTCARIANGKVYCWGWNYLGSLGNGSLDWVTVVTPTLVSGINGSVTQIAAERNRTCVLTSLGAVQCWGNGIAAPVTVPGLEANVKSFDIGVDHGCAAMQDNTLRCWGSNAHGQRADSIMASSYISSPVTVVGFDGAPWRSVYLPLTLR